MVYEKFILWFVQLIILVKYIGGTFRFYRMNIYRENWNRKITYDTDKFIENLLLRKPHKAILSIIWIVALGFLIFWLQAPALSSTELIVLRFVTYLSLAILPLEIYSDAITNSQISNIVKTIKPKQKKPFDNKMARELWSLRQERISLTIPIIMLQIGILFFLASLL